MRKKGAKVLFAMLVAVLIGSVPIAAYAVITIRYATYLTPAYPELYPAMQKFVEVVNQKGKGKVKVEFFPSQTLLKAKELFSGLMAGAAEAVTVPMVYWHGTLPVSQGLSLPFIWKGDLERYKNALAQGAPVASFLNENFARKNIFSIFGILEGREYLWTIKNKSVRRPEDAKGLKIRTSGIIPAEVARRIGGSPVNMSSGEVYTALQRGTVDGVFCSFTTVYSRGLQEQVRYMTNYPFDNLGPILIAFRKDWYNKLPGDVQAIIADAGKAFSETLFSKSMEATRDQLATLRKSVEFIELSPDSFGAFNNILLPIYDWWLDRKEIGESGKRILDLIKATEK